jgi:hypothetical protein
MLSCSCKPACNPRARPVLLDDGREVCSWSGEWREVCAETTREALVMLDTFRDKFVRLRHLDQVEAKRGKAARDRLAAEVMRIWEARKARRFQDAAE